mmetsp:Transcript_52412/g.162699  ORF Transcript_52412/g.162699 Transcript_52412/m.162699 type:complete len:211 (-) Transcript_52412:29-661(-)
MAMPLQSITCQRPHAPGKWRRRPTLPLRLGLACKPTSLTQQPPKRRASGTSGAGTCTGTLGADTAGWPLENSSLACLTSAHTSSGTGAWSSRRGWNSMGSSSSVFGFCSVPEAGLALACTSMPPAPGPWPGCPANSTSRGSLYGVSPAKPSSEWLSRLRSGWRQGRPFSGVSLARPASTFGEAADWHPRCHLLRREATSVFRTKGGCLSC